MKKTNNPSPEEPTRLPVVLKEATWMVTLSASSTKSPDDGQEQFLLREDGKTGERAAEGGILLARRDFGDGVQRVSLRWAQPAGDTAATLSLGRLGDQWVAIARDVAQRPVAGVPGQVCPRVRIARVPPAAERRRNGPVRGPAVRGRGRGPRAGREARGADRVEVPAVPLPRRRGRAGAVRGRLASRVRPLGFAPGQRTARRRGREQTRHP